MAKNRIEDLTVGQCYEKKYIITEEQGKEFAKISSDFNPIHIDEQVAKQTRFKKKIVHGMLMGSYISGIIGNEFPGEGTVYLNQELSFRKPVYYDVTVTIRVEIEKIDFLKKYISLKTICMNEENDILIDGKALVLLEN